MKYKEYTPVAALAALLLILIFVFYKCGAEKKIIDEVPAPTTETETLSDEPRETQTIVLYYLSEKNYFLHSEEREIYPHSDRENQVKQVIEELLRGSLQDGISPFPPAAKLRELFISEDGIAYVDLSKEAQEYHISGSAAEIASVFSLVNTLTKNFKAIKRVFILIDGGERETLRGHVDLKQPLLPRYDLIQK